MLTAAQFDEITTPIADFWEEYTQTVIEDIVRRLIKLGDPTKVTATAAWQAQRLSESGVLYRKILDEISKRTGISRKLLQAAFHKAGVKTMDFDDAIYRAAGLNPIPLNLSRAMLDVLKAGLTRTSGVVENFVRSTALEGQRSFLRASDIAYNQVVTGAFDYGSAIKAAVKKIADTGLRVVTFPGRQDHLDVAVRRAVLTGVAQTSGEIQNMRSDDMGVDLVQTSAHIGARPTHEPWQGKVFSRSGTSKKYPPFVETTGYGTVTGLLGVNCRHSFFPFFEGLSEVAYTEKDLKDFAEKTVMYNGEKLSIYEATQKQRYIERNIRYWKRQAQALEIAGQDNSYELQKVKQWQAKARDFVRQTGLRRQSDREQVLKLAPPTAIGSSKHDFSSVVAEFVKDTSYAARSVNRDLIKINQEQFSKMSQEGKINLLSHELAHSLVEDVVLKTPGEWDKAVEVLLLKTKETETGIKFLFIHGESRLGEAMVSSIAAFVTDAGIPENAEWSIEQWEKMRRWSSRALEIAGLNKQTFNLIVDRLLRSLK